MGWTFAHKDESTSVLDFLKLELGGGSDGPVEFLATATKGSVIYCACKSKVSGETFGLVVLTKRDSRSHYNFGWKDMGEEMGPCESECPDRILELLTPTDYEYANNWRARCREYNERQKAIKAKPKPVHGDTVKFAQPLKFTNGDKGDTFEIRFKDRKVTFHRNYGNYRITKWREREYEILPKAA